jgi:ABC-type nitrate/sulfonate/bicarbonate transport system ATPase subunit
MPFSLSLERITKVLQRDGYSLPVLADITLQAEAGSFVSVIGPSGAGKTTLFNIIAGLDEPTSGRILINGHQAPKRLGRIAYMPQKDLLLPWRNVLDNAIIGLEVQGIERSRARRQALELMPRFGLAGFEAEYPAALSGGMRQRVAFLRTFLAARDIMLLDEPFGALDALTRSELQDWLLSLWQDLNLTVLMITHDVDEAVLMSDRVYVVSPRPAKVLLALEIDLPRPRSSVTTSTLPAFMRYRTQLLATLRGGSSLPTSPAGGGHAK